MAVSIEALGNLRNGVNFNQTQEGFGLPVVKVKDFGARFSVPESGLDELDPSRIAIANDLLLQEGDTLIIRSNGNGELVGRCLFVRNVKQPTTFSGFCIRFRPDSRKINPRYATYLLRSPLSRQQMVAFGSGTGIQNLNQRSIGRIETELPTLDQQKSVARLIGCLDDKIESNEKANQALELLASSLFRSWFVDFDPVAAKRDGKTPVGVPAVAIDLFPNHFEESELGPIPQGWRPSTIGAGVTVVGGSTPRTNEPRFWNGDVCFVTPRDLSRLDDPVVLDTERHITEEGLGQISSGLLPAGTVLLSSRAPIGYIAIAEVPVAVNQGFIAMKCDKAISSHFTVNWVRENLDEVLSRAGGTTFAEISKAAFRPIPLVVPPPGVLELFDAIVAPLHAMRVANVRESSTLVELRDTLLDPLISGELTIKSAEKAVGAVL